MDKPKIYWMNPYGNEVREAGEDNHFYGGKSGRDILQPIELVEKVEYDKLVAMLDMVSGVASIDRGPAPASFKEAIEKYVKDHIAREEKARMERMVEAIK